MRNLIFTAFLLSLIGCIPPMAMAPVFKAEGSWTGNVEPVNLHSAKTNEQQTGILLTIADGPPAQQTTGESQGRTQPMAGRRVLLVNDSGKPFDWKPEFEHKRAKVSGEWDSRNEGFEVAEGSATLRNGERATYSLLKADHVSWLPGHEQ
jgi:hypothetical protein